MPLSVGDRLGPYEILEPIGKGGMGEVYRAKDTKLERNVAIKVLPDAVAQDRERLARFEREARVLASLNHPNIAQIYGLEESGATQALVMELVQGDILKTPQPLETALNYAKQIADALEAAHEKGITHRDLKPANIMITPEGLVKVLDFGLASTPNRERDGAGDSTNSPTLTMTATQAGMIMGTAAYMSPEQAVGAPVDRRTDIWAYGVVLWQMLIGKQLFSGDTVAHILANVINSTVDFSKLPETTPVPIRDLLRRCLDRDVKSRLQWIGEARVAIQKYLVDPRGGAEIPAQAIPLPHKANKIAWVAAGVFAMASVALGVKLWALWRTAPEPAKPVRFQLAPENVTIASSFRFALSPDGTKLAYQASGSDGVIRLWVRFLDTLEARPLPATDVVANVPFFWSYDSRFVVFASAGSLKQIETAGGPPQTLCAVTGIPVGGSWNREGVIIFGHGTAGPLMQVPSEGGTATPVTVIDPARNELYHQSPVFLPDGRHFLYLRRGGSESTGIYVGSLDEKPDHQPSKRLLAAEYGVEFAPTPDGSSGQIIFLREGTLFAQSFDLQRLELSGDSTQVADHVSNYRFAGQFSASQTALVYRTGSAEEGFRLVWFDRQGNELGRTSESGFSSDTVSLSPEGSRVAAERVNGGAANIWLVSFPQGGKTRFTYSPIGRDRFAAWSPDGARIAFSSARSGHYDLYQHAANGAGEDQLLLKSDTDKSVFDWSRDGRFLLYGDTDPKTRRDLWVLPMGGSAGEQKPIPFLRTEFDEIEGRFSPDGRWIAYASSESGRGEVYVRPFPAPEGGGGKWMVSQSGGGQPRWRRDGRELFFVGITGQLFAASVTVSGSALQVGVPKPMFDSGLVGGYAWEVNADGTRFLLPKAGRDIARAPFTVLLNWQGALKK